jgi:regulator of sirC expression with transglutaminase-like and TPR domain
MSFDPRECFAAVAREPDARIDLARGALLVAAEEYPGLDVEAQLARLDTLAQGAAPGMAGRGPRERAERLAEFLFREEGFAGNAQSYDDPRNSFLNEVLDRRLGIPITLALVYLEVARRLSLPACGVGFPGHFLARVELDPPLLLDAFHGRWLCAADCEALLRGFLGAGAQLAPALHLRAATPREILLRLLANLKQIYVRRRDFGRALACCERSVLLVPDAPLELRDRGLVYQQLECYAAARADLRRFLALAPDDASAPAVAARLRELERSAPRLQ